MPRHATMWLATGGAAMLSAALTYLATRPTLATAWQGLRRTAERSGATVRQHGLRRDDVTETGAASGPVENAAFRDYREAALKRLDQEEREFRAFLDRIRLSRDRAELDAFLGERKVRSDTALGGPGT